MKVLYQESRNLTSASDGEQSVAVIAFWGQARNTVPAYSVRGIELQIYSDNELKNKGSVLIGCAGLTDAETVRKAIALFDAAVKEMNNQELPPDDDAVDAGEAAWDALRSAAVEQQELNQPTSLLIPAETYRGWLGEPTAPPEDTHG